MRTRNGKIARLPHLIREQINQRLRDGQQARPVLDWLNSSAEVQAILAAQFGGRPVTPCNLSEVAARRLPRLASRTAITRARSPPRQPESPARCARSR